MRTNGKAAHTGECETRPNEENRERNSFEPTLTQLIQARKDAERLTDLYGAELHRRLIWPQKRFHHVGLAFPDQVEGLRELVAGGDEALVQGPLEIFVVLAGGLAIAYREAMR